MTAKDTPEETLEFRPKYNANGLIPCITTNKEGQVLMFAWMNAEALRKTLETGEAYYWSRSRNELWRKGATSGHVQKTVEMRVDCDQDCLLLTVEDVSAACHTGRPACFYRVVEKNGKNLKWTEEK